MTKKKIIIAFFLLIIIVIAFFSVFKIETICFGDVCPDNGGTFVLYRHQYSEKECQKIGGSPIIGIGWTPVYAGCSPLNLKF